MLGLQLEKAGIALDAGMQRMRLVAAEGVEPGKADGDGAALRCAESAFTNSSAVRKSVSPIKR